MCETWLISCELKHFRRSDCVLWMMYVWYWLWRQPTDRWTARLLSTVFGKIISTRWCRAQHAAGNSSRTALRLMRTPARASIADPRNNGKSLFVFSRRFLEIFVLCKLFVLRVSIFGAAQFP